MSYFPSSIIPLSLKPETSAEVDGAPNIFNAHDYNLHRRELVAIEKALLGKQSLVASGVSGFSCSNLAGASACPNGGGTGGNGTNGMTTGAAQALQQVQALIDQISNGGLMGQFCGAVRVGGAVPLPPSLVATVCQAPLLASATSIPVESTAGFPSTGFITKFNNDPMQLECQASPGTPLPPGGRCVGGRQVWNLAGLVSPGGLHATNQEFIRYASLTPTSFEGCTRGYGGTTAQDLVNNGVFNTQALIANGRATIFLSCNFWGASKTNPTQVILAHDSMLNVGGLVLQDGQPSNVASIGTVIEAAYALTVIGQFDSPNVSGAFGG